MVEHVAAGEQKDGNERDGRPDGTALNDGQHVRPSDVGEGQAARENDKGRDPAHPVDRPLDGRVGAVG